MGQSISSSVESDINSSLTPICFANDGSSEIFGMVALKPRESLGSKFDSVHVLSLPQLAKVHSTMHVHETTCPVVLLLDSESKKCQLVCYTWHHDGTVTSLNGRLVKCPASESLSIVKPYFATPNRMISVPSTEMCFVKKFSDAFQQSHHFAWGLHDAATFCRSLLMSILHQHMLYQYVGDDVSRPVVNKWATLDPVLSARDSLLLSQEHTTSLEDHLLSFSSVHSSSRSMSHQQMMLKTLPYRSRHRDVLICVPSQSDVTRAQLINQVEADLAQETRRSTATIPRLGDLLQKLLSLGYTGPELERGAAKKELLLSSLLTELQCAISEFRLPQYEVCMQQLRAIGYDASALQEFREKMQARGVARLDVALVKRNKEEILSCIQQLERLHAAPGLRAAARLEVDRLEQEVINGKIKKVTASLDKMLRGEYDTVNL